MVSYVSTIVIVLGAGVAITGGMLGFMYLPDYLEAQIKESVKLIEGSDAWDRWEVLPLPVVYKIYFFNVNNPVEVGQGAVPNVTEIGPFCYNQYRTKMNITRDDDILSYYQHMHFEFDEVASAPLTAYDEITILNLPLMSSILAAEMVAGTSLWQLTALNSQISRLFDSPTTLFLTTTPQEFLFDGVYIMCNTTRAEFLANSVCERMEENAPPTMPRLEDGRFKFTLLGYKNDTHDGLYSINSGTDDVFQLGEIVAWENSSVVDTWPEIENGTCNNIFGSDASLFPPFRTEESEVNIFNTDICRSVRTGYAKDSEYAGIDALRYEPKDDFLASATIYPENECFCLNKTEGIRGDDGCLLAGVMEAYDCLGAPLVVSYPHFYKADAQYQDGVIGLNPDASLHEMFMDLEPNSGTLLRGSKKAQFNMFIKYVERFNLTENVSTALVPIVWIDEGVELNDDLISMLNSELLTPILIVKIVPWVSMAVGALVFSGGVIWFSLSLMRTGKSKGSGIK